MTEQDTAAFAKDNLGRHKQFALGTVDEDGKPWVVCLNLAYDEQYNFIWKSEKNTEHSRHVRSNPNVSLCVFSETEGVGDFGFYAKAVAHEVTDVHELRRLLPIRYAFKQQPAPPAEQFLGAASSRLYYAEITEAWINNDAHVKREVDLRILANIL